MRAVAPTPTSGTLAGMASINGGEPIAAQLRITQERIDISTRGPKADPKWTFTDAAGHFHARSDDELPTLIARPVHVPCDGSCGGICGGEGTEVIRYHCRICEEEIKPGQIPGPHYAIMAGRVDWEIAVQTMVDGRGEVSVVFRTGQDGYFGVAVPNEMHVERGPDGHVQGRTMLHGATMLGRMVA